MNSDLLKNQHKTIQQLFQELEQEISSRDIEQKAFDISLKISKLSGVLVLHLKSEDEYLYPDLKKSESIELRKTAEQLYQEMGSWLRSSCSIKMHICRRRKLKPISPNL